MTHPNESVGRTAKMAALLQYVASTQERPRDMNPGTLAIWEAMESLGIVIYRADGRAWLTMVGRALRQLADRGEI